MEKTVIVNKLKWIRHLIGAGFHTAIRHQLVDDEEGTKLWNFISNLDPKIWSDICMEASAYAGIDGLILDLEKE